jgi:hypothetical protein
MKYSFSSFKYQVSSFKWAPATCNLQLATVLALSFFLLSAKGSGCGKGPSLGATRPATETRSTSYLKKKLRTHDHENLKYLNTQAKVFIEGNGQSINVTANIIWVRDSIMWVNVKKFGLEAARALVTPDSVFVLNRLEKTYSARGLESLQRQYSLPAGFDLIQSLILSTPWFFEDIDLNADIKDGMHRLAGSNGRYSTEYRLEEEAYWLRQELFLQPRDTRTVSISFENYKKTALAGWFPYLRTVEAYSQETGDMRLSIEFNDVEFNVPKSFRFEIPQHYEKVD